MISGFGFLISGFGVETGEGLLVAEAVRISYVGVRVAGFSTLSDSGFRVSGFEPAATPRGQSNSYFAFRISELGFRVPGSGFNSLSDSGFRFRGSTWIDPSWPNLSYFVFRISGSGCRV